MKLKSAMLIVTICARFDKIDCCSLIKSYCDQKIFFVLNEWVICNNNFAFMLKIAAFNFRNI